MNMIEAAKTCFAKFITFSGRARRAEYWKFVLFNFLVTIALVVVNSLIFGPTAETRYILDEAGNVTGVTNSLMYNGGYFTDIYSLIVLLPSLAVGWRRMHDSNRPGYLLFLPFIGMVLAIALAFVGLPAILAILAVLGCIATWLYWLTRPSDPTTNRFGPPPRGTPHDPEIFA